MSGKKVLFGFHAVSSRIRQHPESVKEVYCEEHRRDGRAKDLVSLAERYGVQVLPVDARRLDGLAGHARHQGVVALVEPVQRQKDLEEIIETCPESPLILILDGVQDPHNLGACLRTADGFGVHAVVAPKDRAVGITSVVSKVACGAAESVPFFAVTNLARTLRYLKEQGVWVAGTSAEGPPLYETDVSGPLAWVLGAEGAGMRRLTRELCDLVVGIPMSGTVESFNVSVSAGICLYETRRQRWVTAATIQPK